MRNFYLCFYFLAVLLFSPTVISQTDEEKDFNCFTVLIGKEATTDGSVMLAHNEDDWGDRIVNWYKVHKQHKTSSFDSIQLKRGHKIGQIAKTNAYLWLEIPELEFSDSYMNEYGVVVVSNASISREDKPELVNGGIGYWLRRLIAERAKTAREGVEIAGELIESLGYASSGRTYSIADPNETWMLSVVQGKHWVAQRVPDNHIAIIPNYYTIKNVDLTDTSNFLGAKDLVDYAINRGWYNPEADGEFNFREVYSDQDNLKNKGNIARYWVSINALSKEQYEYNEDFPFSFVPKTGIDLPTIFQVLRNHYEGTELNNTDEIKGNNPHKQEAKSVCADTSQYGFVAQLRNWMPIEVGVVMWFAPRRPCTQVFVPIYEGMEFVPKNLAKTDYDTALEKHFDKIEDFEAYTKNHDYAGFDKQAEHIDTDYNTLIVTSKKANIKIEKKLLKKQATFEKKLLKRYQKNPEKTRRKISKYSANHFKKLLRNIK